MNRQRLVHPAFRRIVLTLWALFCTFFPLLTPDVAAADTGKKT